VTQTGFSLGSLTLGQTGGQTVTMGSFLQLTGAVLSATNFAYSTAGGISGTIGLTAAG